jgi:hypothetical protein
MWNKCWGLIAVTLASLLLTAPLARGEAAASSPIPVYITPFYNSKGPEISVGKYSRQLASADRQSIKAIVKAMQEEGRTLSVAAMYVASIRLYDLGYRDDAVRWFYAAQYRGRLFQTLLDRSKVGGIGSSAFELNSAHGAFQQLVGQFVNGYAGCDKDKWVAVLESVRSENRSPPDLAAIYPSVGFLPAEQWAVKNDEINTGLGKFVEHLNANWPVMKAQRAKNNLDEKFCQP